MPSVLPRRLITAASWCSHHGLTCRDMRAVRRSQGMITEWPIHLLPRSFAVLIVNGGAVGAYIGIARARAPLNAPESKEIIERRQRFRSEHLGQARAAVIIAVGLLVAATVWLIATHA